MDVPPKDDNTAFLFFTYMENSTDVTDYIQTFCSLEVFQVIFGFFLVNLNLSCWCSGGSSPLQNGQKLMALC